MHAFTHTVRCHVKHMHVIVSVSHSHVIRTTVATLSRFPSKVYLSYIVCASISATGGTTGRHSKGWGLLTVITSSARKFEGAQSRGERQKHCLLAKHRLPLQDSWWHPSPVTPVPCTFHKWWLFIMLHWKKNHNFFNLKLRFGSINLIILSSSCFCVSSLSVYLAVVWGQCGEHSYYAM